MRSGQVIGIFGEVFKRLYIFLIQEVGAHYLSMKIFFQGLGVCNWPFGWTLPSKAPKEALKSIVQIPDLFKKGKTSSPLLVTPPTQNVDLGMVTSVSRGLCWVHDTGFVTCLVSTSTFLKLDNFHCSSITCFGLEPIWCSQSLSRVTCYQILFPLLCLHVFIHHSENRSSVSFG